MKLFWKIFNLIYRHDPHTVDKKSYNAQNYTTNAAFWNILEQKKIYIYNHKESTLWPDATVEKDAYYWNATDN